MEYNPPIKVIHNDIIRYIKETRRDFIGYFFFFENGGYFRAKEKKAILFNEHNEKIMHEIQEKQKEIEQLRSQYKYDTI